MPSFESVLVVVVTYNSENDIRGCLESLMAQRSISSKIVVVDNASDDDTAGIVSREFPEVALVRSPVNSGYTGGCNVGMRESDSTYVAFVNPDTISHPDWLQNAVSVLESRQGIGACQPKILLRDDTERLNSRGNQANFLFFAWPDGYGEIDDEECQFKTIPYASGAAAVYKRECLDKIGPLDESYFMYHDDFDLGMRSFLIGYDTVYSSESNVAHNYRFKESPQHYFLLERNRLLSLLKIYRWKTLFMIAPAFLLVELSVIIHSLVDGWLLVKVAAYGSLIRNVPRTLRVRSSIQETRTRPDSDVIRALRGSLDFMPISESWMVKRGNSLLRKYQSFLAGLDL